MCIRDSLKRSDFYILPLHTVIDLLPDCPYYRADIACCVHGVLTSTVTLIVLQVYAILYAWESHGTDMKKSPSVQTP